MNRIEELFSGDRKNILSIYFTAGFPKLDDTNEILAALLKNGAGMIEIGMPYSDPLADGPVIQQSSMKALENGMTIGTLFQQLYTLPGGSERKVPFILMGYLNPVIQYGLEKFCEHARNAGVDGLIIPDLPLDVYEKEYKSVFDKYDLRIAFLVTPQTPDERIRKIDVLSNAFIYVVSSYSITGGNTNIDAQQAYFDRLQKMGLKNKLMIGFGIRDQHSFHTACRHAAGAIIGTAYIQALEKGGSPADVTKRFLNSILMPA